MQITYMPHNQAYIVKYGKLYLSANKDRLQAISDALRRLKAKKILLLRD